MTLSPITRASLLRLSHANFLTHFETFAAFMSLVTNLATLIEMTNGPKTFLGEHNFHKVLNRN